MIRVAAIVLLLVQLSPGIAAAAERDAYENSVVGLLVSYQDWDDDRPWAKTQPGTRHGSGVVVEGGAILTTALMVSNATLIRLERNGRALDVTPRVVLVDRQVDLALLSVDETAFTDGLEPVRLARRTPTAGSLRTVRWNGQQIEASASRVKRFEVHESRFSDLRHVFMLVETDMAGGGWAEPLFDGDRLVGLSSSQDERQVRVIPAEVLSTFLQRARSPESYSGFPVFGVHWQLNEDPALASYLGQTGPPRGVLVRQVPWGSSGCGVLRPRDILLAVDGHDIDAEGFYTHPYFGQLEYTNIIVDGHAVGDRVPVRVLREGRVLDLEMTLRRYPSTGLLVPQDGGDQPPPFLIAGGLLFRELDGDYLRTWGSEWATRAPLVLLTTYWLEREMQSSDRRRVVLLTAVLPSTYNLGYHDVRDVVVESINGRAIDSIGDVADAFASPVDGFHTVVLAPNPVRHEIVLDAATLEAATAEILETYRIPTAMRLPVSPPPDLGPPCR